MSSAGRKRVFDQGQRKVYKGVSMKQKKTEMMYIKVSPKDRAAIEKAAAKNGMLPAEYIRACTITMMCAEFDGHALRCLAGGLSDAIGEIVSSVRGSKLAIE